MEASPAFVRQKLITDETIALENPDSSITLPKIAPSMNTGK
jgi:hypothetical protein